MTESMHRQRWTTRVAGAVLRTRWIVRAPIRLYRLRLGGVFGTRLLMLEHTGRSSGKPRYVVLEIIDRPDNGGYVVASGFGVKAQWYRNIAADPHVRLYLGSRAPVAAIARRLCADEAAESLQNYAENYPKAWEALRPVLEQAIGVEISGEGSTLPLVIVTPS